MGRLIVRGAPSTAVEADIPLLDGSVESPRRSIGTSEPPTVDLPSGPGPASDIDEVAVCVAAIEKTGVALLKLATEAVDGAEGGVWLGEQVAVESVVSLGEGVKVGERLVLMGTLCEVKEAVDDRCDREGDKEATLDAGVCIFGRGQ